MNFPTLIFEHFVGVETYTVRVHVPLANVPFQIYSMLCREKTVQSGNRPFQGCLMVTCT